MATSERDEPAEAPKKEWTEPTLEVIDARDAELGSTLGGADHGSNVS
jgi:hypothetical protein